MAGRIRGIVVLASDFSERLNRSDTAPVQVIVDGSDPNTGALIRNYVQGVWRTWLVQESLEKGARARPPVSIEARFWFNPEVDSRHFLIPGGIAVIMTLVGTLLTALVVAREWERGTMEALLATPVGRFELLLGKVIPYFAQPGTWRRQWPSRQRPRSSASACRSAGRSCGSRGCRPRSCCRCWPSGCWSRL